MQVHSTFGVKCTEKILLSAPLRFHPVFATPHSRVFQNNGDRIGICERHSLLYAKKSNMAARNFRYGVAYVKTLNFVKPQLHYISIGSSLKATKMADRSFTMITDNGKDGSIAC